jgi:hypothetical protein
MKSTHGIVIILLEIIIIITPFPLIFCVDVCCACFIFVLGCCTNNGICLLRQPVVVVLPCVRPIKKTDFKTVRVIGLSLALRNMVSM